MIGQNRYGRGGTDSLLKFKAQSVAPPSDGEPVLYRVGDKLFLRDASGVVLPLVVSASGAGVASIAFADTPRTLTSDEVLAMVDTTSGAVTVKLPASSGIQIGHRVRVIDSKRQFGTNACTVDGNGKNINGASTLVLNVQDGGGEFTWNGTTWTYQVASSLSVGTLTATNETLTGTLSMEDNSLLQMKGRGTGTGDVIQRIGPTTTEGLELRVIDVTVSPAAIETAVATLPAGSIPIAIMGNVQSALTGGGTTVTWSIGTAATPNKYGTAGYPSAADSLAKNSKSRFLGPFIQLTSAEPIVVTGAATGGSADGDTALTVGSIRVLIVYWTCNDLDDAP